jgi:hypothetical protein
MICLLNDEHFVDDYISGQQEKQGNRNPPETND